MNRYVFEVNLENGSVLECYVNANSRVMAWVKLIADMTEEDFYCVKLIGVETL